MKRNLIFFFPLLLLFPSCMMHIGMHEMSGMHRQDRAERPVTIHVMDERYHVDISINPVKNGYRLFIFSIINAQTKNQVEGIEGWLIDELNEIEVPLLPDQTTIGVYTAVMSEVSKRKNDNLFLLDLLNDDEEASLFEFRLQPSHQHDGHHGRRVSGINLKTAAIIGGAAMAVMMIVVHGWWIIR